MADSVLQSPRNPHFFQPLLPNFHSHLSVPVKFFKLHLEGRYEGEMVELRTDACERAWKVKMEGQRLTLGWKEFAISHDFRIGDVVIFRYQGDLVFHVTGFGPSFCEIQYVHSSNNKDILDDDDDEEEEEEDNIRKLPNQRVASSSNENPFVKLIATPANLERSGLYLPKSFTRVHKLKKGGGKKISMLDKDGVEWPVKLVMEKTYTRMRLCSGLKEFLNANDIKAYESFVLELVWKDISTPMLKFCYKD